MASISTFVPSTEPTLSWNIPSVPLASASPHLLQTHNYTAGWPPEQHCTPFDRRSTASVLWSLTVTYLAALTAYGQLLYSFQREKSILTIGYRLAIFVVFPIYPVISLLGQFVRALVDWGWWHQKNHIFLLSRISGLQVAQVDGRSEPLHHLHAVYGRHLQQERWSLARLGRAVGLLLITSQCVGTFVRVLSRLGLKEHYYGGGYYKDDWQGRRYYEPRSEYVYPLGSDAWLAEDYESLLICIGTLGILAKSWLAYCINVQWIEDRDVLPSSLDRTALRRRRVYVERFSGVSPSAIAAEAMFDIPTRILILFILWVICMVFLLSIDDRAWIGLLYPWAIVLMPAIPWLRRSDAQAVHHGKEVFMSGYFATIACIPLRLANYGFRYLPLIVDRWGRLRLFPWPLVFLGLFFSIRLLLPHIHCIYRGPINFRAGRSSHFLFVVLATTVMVVFPAYLHTLRGSLQWYREDKACPGGLLSDPFWTPTF